MPGAEPPPPPPAPTPELPPERPGVGWTWLVAGLPLGLLAAALDLRVYRQYVAGEVWWKSWEHDAGATWHWVPFIHPPLFTEYMRAFERRSGETGTPEGELLMVVSALLAPLVVLLAARLAADGTSNGRWVAFAAALLVITPAGLRPFEQYPLARLILTASLVSLLLYARRGGLLRWLPAFAFALLTVEFHLSSWFLLGPLLAMLWITLPDRRRGLGVLTLLILVLFMASTSDTVAGNSLMDVFDQPTVEQRKIFVPPSWKNPTLEYNNLLLYTPLLLWLVPAVRRTDPRGLPVALAIGVYVVVHLALMQQGMAINSNAPEPHHYFEMTDPLVTAAVVWALAAAWGTWTGTRARAALGVMTGVLAISQVVSWFRVHAILVEAAPLW